MKCKKKKQNSNKYIGNDNHAYNSIISTLSIEGYEYSPIQKNALYDYLTNRITRKKMEGIIDGTEK